MAAQNIIKTIDKADVKLSRSNVVKHIYHPLRNKLYVPTTSGIYLIPFENILRIESDSNYCWVYLKDGIKHLIAKTLKEVHYKLPQNLFLRIHNSHVVNASEIMMIDKSGLILSDNVNIPVGRKFKKELNDLLKEIKF